jgi:S1-C subfamily serine protease
MSNVGNEPSDDMSDTVALLQELAQRTRVVAGRVGPAVVRVGRGGGRGSGVVIGQNQILTNAHHLRGTQITIQFADGRAVIGDVVGADLDGDLAVISADTAGAAPIRWADTSADIGDVVFSVARSASGAARTTWGTVSATERAFRGPRGRRIDGSLEHTAPLAPRSSGSPVVDLDGRLVGLNTNRVGEGFYLALPVTDRLRRTVEALAAGTEPVQRHLGVALAPAAVARKLRRSVGLPERDGLLVRGVEPGQPAARAGVQEGDLIVRAGGHEIATVDDLYRALDEAGDPLDLLLVRGTDEIEVSVSFGRDPDESAGDAGTEPADPQDEP